MLTSRITRSAPPFFRQIDTGVVTLFPEMTYCQLEFDTHYYADALFSDAGIPFPSRLDNAVARRRAEYFAARSAARFLLQDAGCEEHVHTSASRAPVWPAGWCGSLSHSEEHAIAIIAPLHAGLTPGIDIEMFDDKTMRETAEMFTTPQERQRLLASGLAYETALLIAFSAKESVFKALYPQVGHLFGFEAARVSAIDATTCRLTLELTQSLSPSCPQGRQLQGHFLLKPDRVITLIA